MNETFCGFCNRIFADGRSQCDCGRTTALMTDAHRAPNIFLLSGLGSAPMWSPERPTTDHDPVVEAFRRYGCGGEG